MSEKAKCLKRETDINCDLSEDEQNEEIEYVWIVVSNMALRALALSFQTIVSLIPIVGFFTGQNMLPRIEHHGIVFLTKNGNYYSTDFMSSGSNFINFRKDKNESFKIIANHVHQKKIWIKLKGKIKENTILKIKNICDIIPKITPKTYHAIKRNCQLYIDLMWEEISNKFNILGFDSGWVALHMGGGVCIGGDRSY